MKRKSPFEVNYKDMRELFLEVVYRHSPIEMILWGVGAVALWTGLAFFFSKEGIRWNWWTWINRVGLIVIFVIIVRYTLLRGFHQRTAKLTPFYSFSYSWSSDRYNTLAANMLLFLPIGMYMPFGFGKERLANKPVRITVLTGFLFSFFVEAAQYIFAIGLCETDDVIFNTLGVAMGTLSYVIFTYQTIKRKDIFYD